MGEAPDDHDEPRDRQVDPRLDPRVDPRLEDEFEDELEDQFDEADPAVGIDDGLARPFDLGEADVTTRIAHARQRHGIAGGFLAAGMLGVDQAINGRKPREEAPIVVAANSDPIDIDRDGISVPIDDTGTFAVAAPPLPRRAPITPSRASRRRAR